MQLNLFPEESKEAQEAQEECTTLFCRKCQTEKALDQYCLSIVEWETQPHIKGARGLGGTARYCRSCHKEYKRGLATAKRRAPPRPTEDIHCDLCNVLTPSSKVHMDHCHVTHEFRGWLCRSCNIGLGALGDNLEGLERAIKYLKDGHE